MSDVIAAMLTAIRNAQLVKRPVVKVPYAKVNAAILTIWERHKIVGKVEKTSKRNGRYLEVELRYRSDGSGALMSMKRVSKSSQRVYVGYHKLHWPRGTMVILSTPQGIMTGVEAKKQKVGGEVLCSFSA
jgi:small subunit ribosomal protein S8